MLAFLDKREMSGAKAVSIYLPPGITTEEAGKFLETASHEPELNRELASLAAASQTGAAIYLEPSRKYLIIPPFPVCDKYLTPGCDLEPLRAMLKRDFTIATILVRLGSYAIGISKGDRLITSKVGTGLIHARHKKGGSSQSRFQRHREKQIEVFLDRVCRHIGEYLEPCRQEIDYVACGGSRMTLHRLKQRCPFLDQFRANTLPLQLEIPEPRRKILEETLSRIWSTTVTEWDTGNHLI